MPGPFFAVSLRSARRAAGPLLSLKSSCDCQHRFAHIRSSASRSGSLPFFSFNFRPPEPGSGFAAPCGAGALFSFARLRRGRLSRILTPGWVFLRVPLGTRFSHSLLFSPRSYPKGLGIAEKMIKCLKGARRNPSGLLGGATLHTQSFMRLNHTPSTAGMPRSP